MNGNTRLFIKSGLKARVPQLQVTEPTKQPKDRAMAWGMDWLKNEALPIMVRRIESIYLYRTREVLGTGKKKLLEIHDGVVPMIKQMLEDYVYDMDSDAMWICEYKLKTEVGINMDELKSPFSVNAVFEEDEKRMRRK